MKLIRLLLFGALSGSFLGHAHGGPILVTGAGPGGGPHVRVFDTETGQELLSFFAFDPDFAGGVHVAAADVNGDGHPDIITAAGPGGGPHVRIFDGAAARAGALVELHSFFAYRCEPVPGPCFHGGAFVAAMNPNTSGPTGRGPPGPGGRLARPARPAPSARRGPQGRSVRRARPGPPVRPGPQAPSVRQARPAPPAPRGPQARPVPPGPQAPSAFIVGGSTGTANLSNSAARFVPVFSSNSSASEAAVSVVFPVAGTLSNLDVRLDGTAGASPRAYTFSSSSGPAIFSVVLHSSPGGVRCPGVVSRAISLRSALARTPVRICGTPSPAPRCRA